jgi:hypothetical protein
MPDIVQSILSKDSGIAAVAATLLSLLTLATQFRSFRALSKERFRDLDERTKAVAFWQAWVTAQLACSDTDGEKARAKSEARAKLYELAKDDDRGAVSSHRGWRSALLFYLPTHHIAWVPRTLFYLSVVGGLVYGLGGIAQLLGELARRQAIDQDLTGFSLYLFCIGLVAGLLRQLALWVDRDETSLASLPRVNGHGSAQKV